MLDTPLFRLVQVKPACVPKLMRQVEAFHLLMRGYMNKSTKLLLASVSPVALAAGWLMLDAAPAHATMSVAGQGVTFAAENFSGASASNTIIVGATGFTVSSNTGASTDWAAGSVTFTLSNSATFAAAPSPTTANGTTLSSGALVTGSTAVTYTTSVTGTSLGAVTLGNFTVTGVGSRLATAGNTVALTFASIGSNVPATASATIALSSQAYTFTVGAATAVAIDLANSGSGLVFRTSTNLSNVTFSSLGTLSQAAAAAGNDISGATLFNTGASDTLRATVTGNLSAFSSVYAASAACAATAPTGAITGTVTSTSATINGLVVGSLYNICAIANGTSIIPAGTITGSAQWQFAARTVSGATYTPGAITQTASTLGSLSYNGSTSTAYYVVGAGSYTSAIRLTNTSSSAGSVFVQVTPDTTGTPVRALLDSTLAAGQSKFYLASDLRTAVGTSVLTDSNNRATVVFLTSFTGLQLQNFILNPGGVLSGGTSVGSANTSGN